MLWSLSALCQTAFRYLYAYVHTFHNQRWCYRVPSASPGPRLSRGGEPDRAQIVIVPWRGHSIPASFFFHPIRQVQETIASISRSCSSIHKWPDWALLCLQLESKVEWMSESLLPSVLLLHSGGTSRTSPFFLRGPAFSQCLVAGRTAMVAARDPLPSPPAW